MEDKTELHIYKLLVSLNSKKEKDILRMLENIASKTNFEKTRMEEIPEIKEEPVVLNEDIEISDIIGVESKYNYDTWSDAIKRKPKKLYLTILDFLKDPNSYLKNCSEKICLAKIKIDSEIKYFVVERGTCEVVLIKLINSLNSEFTKIENVKVYDYTKEE